MSFTGKFPKKNKKIKKGELDLIICKKCKLVYYCSKRCQKCDWNKYNHKLVCSYF